MPSSNRKLLENLSFQSIAEFAGKGLQAVYTIYLANVLGAEGMGIYGFANSIVALFLIIVSFGLDVYGTREIASDKINIHKTVVNIFSLRLFLAIGSYLLLIIFVLFFINDIIVQFAILILGINIFSNAILLNWVFQGIEKMGIIAIRQVVVSSLSLILILLFVNNYDDSLLAFGIIAGSMLLNSVLMSIYYSKKFDKLAVKIDKQHWNKIIRASIPIGMFAILVSIMNNIDISLIYALAENSKFESGIYNATYRIVAFAIVPAVVVQNAFFPQLSRENEMQEKKHLLIKYSRLMNTVACFTGIITYFYSNFIINTILVDEYVNSIPLMKLFAFSIFIVYLNVSLSSSLVAWNGEKKVFYSTIFAVLANIIMDIILIPHYGAYGATIATVIAEYSLFLLLTYHIYKEVGVTLFLNSASVIVMGVVSVLPSYFYVDNSVGSIVGILLTLVLFVLIVHFSGYLRLLDIKKILRT